MRNCVLIAFILMLALPLVAAEPKKGLIIVTTKVLEEGSKQLPVFVKEKEKRGFKVLVATEDEYGGAGVVGQEKAVLIREWLKTVKDDYGYVLLIGYPHRDYGDIPMVRFWSREGMSGLIPGIMNEWADTDWFYADLTGNWDMNGNGKFGQPGEFGAGGVSFKADLIPGRIAVYFDNTDDLDAVLATAVSFMNHTKAFADAYRYKFLFPMAIWGFKGMTFIGANWPEDEDSAGVAEWFITNRLSSDERVVVSRMYERDGYKPSQWPSELALSEENLVAEWSSGYGMVMWGAHGAPDAVARVVWREHKGEGELPLEGEIDWPTMLSWKSAHQIETDAPAFAVAVSCDVGQSQQPDNLANHLLISGAAVGMVASSVAGPRSKSFWHDQEAPLDTTTFGDDNVGPLFYINLLAGMAAGEALAAAKATTGTAMDSETATAKASFNYFGDPTLKLTDPVEDIVAEVASDYDTVTDDGTTPDTDTAAKKDEGGGCSLTLF